MTLLPSMISRPCTSADIFSGNSNSKVDAPFSRVSVLSYFEP